MSSYSAPRNGFRGSLKGAQGAESEHFDLPSRYRKIRPRASADGGFACVAEDMESGFVVFFKVARDVDAIHREVKILEAIAHASVPKLIEWGHLANSAFLVTTSLGDCDLETYLSDHGGILSPTEVTSLMQSLADILDAVHRSGFIHRDLKPANIMLSDDMAPSIVDFGAAMAVDQSRLSDRPDWLTHGYAAPEQYIQAAKEGPWTDVYGLAATAYRALIGRPPPSALARQSGQAALALADSGFGGRDAEVLLGAVEGGLALDPNERPQGAKAWADSLSIETETDKGPLPSFVGPDEDAYPPTVLVKRVVSETASGEHHGPDEHVQSASIGSSPFFRRHFMWLLLAASIVILGFWPGRSIYDRYVKRDWLVDASGAGDAATISEALRRGRADARIKIAPGIYKESVTVDGAQQLMAANPDDPPIISPMSGPCLKANGDGAGIKNVFFRPPSVEKTDRSTELSGCVIVRGADIDFKNNRIAGGPGPGIVIASGSNARIADNELSGIEGQALVVRGGAQPRITGNTIKDAGVIFAEGSRGVFADNRILDSEGSAVEIASGARPELRENMIANAAEAGVYAYDGGGGQLADNRVIESGLSGFLITGSGNTDVVGNEVVGSKEHGILILGPVEGLIEHNDVRRNTRLGIVIHSEAKVVIGENTLDANAEPQIFDGREQ